jgi:hypothetical protein
MSKYTPRPWFWARDKDNQPTSLMRSGSGDYVICPQSDISDYGLSVHSWNDVSDADALLIEAAPDLLKALTALRDELSGVDQWWGKLREAADAADAAIAKATGQ